MRWWLAVCAAGTVAVVGYVSGGSGSVGCSNLQCQCMCSGGNLSCSIWWSRLVVNRMAYLRLIWGLQVSEQFFISDGCGLANAETTQWTHVYKAMA